MRVRIGLGLRARVRVRVSRLSRRSMPFTW